jgi:hypothetical protein
MYAIMAGVSQAHRPGEHRPKPGSTSQQHPGVIPEQARGQPVVFFKNRDAVNSDDWDNNNLTNEEVYIQLCKTIKPEHIEAVQKIGGLWRLYIPFITARCKLLAEGLNIRGRTITIHQNNPFLRTSTNTVMVRVCDVPLSVHDSEIINSLRYVGAEITGECMKEKLRVGGRLVNCLTGNRRIEIKIPKEPLPRFIRVNDFKAKIYHHGQLPNKEITCSNCLEKGHYQATCRNPVKCKQCHDTGHIQMNCTNFDRPVPRQSVQDATVNEVRVPQEEPAQQSTQDQHTVPSGKPEVRGTLKLRAGKLEITPDPRVSGSNAPKSNDDQEDTVRDDNITSQSSAPPSDSSDADNESEQGAQNCSSMSALTPSPNPRGLMTGKRKQKSPRKQKSRRSRTKNKTNFP